MYKIYINYSVEEKAIAVVSQYPSFQRVVTLFREIRDPVFNDPLV